MVNAALIGMGWWGKNLATAVQKKSSELQFVLGVTKEIEETRQFASQLGMDLSNSLEDALKRPDVQAVVLAVPHSLHAQQIIQAAEAGKHVFCEKPLTLNLADAKRAIAACAANHVVLGVGQNKRFWPSMVKLREVVKSGILGEILHVEGHYSNEHSTKFFSDWRVSPDESPAGGLTGTGIHIVDAFVNIAGPAKEVSAKVSAIRGGKDPRDATSVMVQFESGIQGYFAMIRATPIYWRVHVFGDKASVESLHENEVVIRYQGGRIERIVYPTVDSIKAELEAFAMAIPQPGKTTTPYPIPTSEMASCIALFEGIISSVEKKTSVQVQS
ncbi:MAG: Gfo/Idh/MocA family oxidoreductase [Betaproteobacteria bacterium]|jgi:predicted dehydrogenase